MGARRGTRNSNRASGSAGDSRTAAAKIGPPAFRPGQGGGVAFVDLVLAAGSGRLEGAVHDGVAQLVQDNIPGERVG